MTWKWIPCLWIFLLAAQAGAQVTPAAQTQKVSYGIGVGVARNIRAQGNQIPSDVIIKALKEELSGKKPIIADMELQRMVAIFFEVAAGIMKRGIDLNMDLMIKGVEDELLGKKLLVPEREINRTMIMFQVDLKRERGKALKNTAAENLGKGDSFLAENKKKEGVVALPSGLQYKILKAGQGKNPTDLDTVECHFLGTLINGKEFASSYRHGQPETFKVRQVMLGWREALKLMPAGSKWQLFIPPHLAYGLGGKGNDIGPNETLIFELELLAIR